MSVKSSSFADIPPLPPDLSFNSSLHPFTNTCFRSKTDIYIFSALVVAYITTLPVFILVLYLGYQQWRKQRSISAAATSHTDLFTYHSTIMHLNEFLGLIYLFCGGLTNLTEMFYVGVYTSTVAFLGQALFQLLTCVERYLAVVHPIIYRGLRKTNGIRIRNISTACVWILSYGCLAVSFTARIEFVSILYYCSTAVYLIVISFSSIAVLCILRRPGPGEVGGNRQRVDQSRQRAFHTIIIIMGVLLLDFGGSLIISIIYKPSLGSDGCFYLMSSIWFSFPSSFVLPLLYLQRAGKLTCCK